MWCLSLHPWFPLQLATIRRPCHGWYGQSPASHCAAPDWVPDHSMWDLWWTKWHCDRFLSQYFCFPLSVSFHQRSIFIFIYRFFLPAGQTGEAWELSNKLMPFWKSGRIYNQKYFVFLCEWGEGRIVKWIVTFRSVRRISFF